MTEKKEKKLPFLVVCVPEKERREKSYIEMNMQSATPFSHDVPVEVESFFSSDFAVEYHKMVTDFGFQLRYEFTVENWGKIYKRMKLFKGDEEINQATGFNADMRDLASEMVGKLGIAILNENIQKTLMLRAMNDTDMMSDKLERIKIKI